MPFAPDTFVLAVVGGLWLCLPLAAGPPLVQKSGPATLSLEVAWNKGKPEVPYTPPVLLTLTVEGMPPVMVQVPKKWIASDRWHVFPQGKPKETALDQGRVRWQQTFFLEPILPGDHILQLEPVQVEDKAGKQSLSWKPIALQVQKPTREAKVEQIRDTPTIEELPGTESLWPIWGWWLAGGCGLALAGALAWMWWCRQRMRAPVTAAQWAHYEMDRLLALGLPARGQSERFHTVLSNIMRRFLERHIHIPARQQTTPEFFQALTRETRLLPSQHEFLRDFLDRCDLAKFAAAAVAAAECQALADRAREFIKQMAMAPAPTPEVTFPPVSKPADFLSGKQTSHWWPAMTWWKKALLLSIAWPVVLAVFYGILLVAILVWGSSPASQLAAALLIGETMVLLWFFGTIGIWLVIYNRRKT